MALARRPAQAVGDRRARLILAVVCVAQFMVVLDVSIVNVALPDMRRELGLSPSGLAWVVNSYTLTFAGFLLLGGRAADIWGRRRLFLIGVAVFTVTSFVGGLSQSGTALNLARAAQGLGSAMLAPATLTILTTTFTEPRARARAVGLWSAVAGTGGATGVVAGGVLTDLLSWRWILFVNVPIGLAVYLVARGAVAETRAQDRPALDWLGALTATAGLVAVVYAIISTETHPWASAEVVSWLVLGAGLLALFVVVEIRHRDPLVPLRLFRSRALTGANVIMVFAGAVMFSLFFFLSRYLQEVEGFSPMRAGLTFLPIALAVVAGSQLAPVLVHRFGTRIVLVIGPFVSAAGLLWLSNLEKGGSVPLRVGLPASVVTFGIGMSLVPITIAAMGGVDPRYAGLASGLISSMRQIGGSIGLSVLLTIAAARTDSLSDADPAAAEASGFALAFGLAALLMIVSSLTALTVLPTVARTLRSRDVVAAEGHLAP